MSPVSTTNNMIEENLASDCLTPKQLELIGYLASGLRTEIIAKIMRVSVKTTYTHAINIYDRLEVGNRDAAVVEAIRRGIICDPKKMSLVAQIVTFLLYQRPETLGELIDAGIVKL